jgi:hypothetical protein
MAIFDGGLWRTAYEVDFTAAASLNLRTGGNGTKTIDGKVWTWGNDANCTSASVTNGTGIVIVASATSTGFYEGGNTRSAPNLTIPLSTVFPQFTYGQSTVRVMLRVLLTNAGANAEGIKFGIEDATTPVSQHFWIAKWFSGALSYRVSEGYDPTYTTIYADNAANVSDDVMGFVWSPPNTVEAYTGLYSAGRPLKFTHARGSWYSRVATQLLFVPTQPRLVIAQVTNNTNNDLTTTITHMRVDYASRHPAL